MLIIYYLSDILVLSKCFRTGFLTFSTFQHRLKEGTKSCAWCVILKLFTWYLYVELWPILCFTIDWLTFERSKVRLILFTLGNLPVERAKDAVCFLQWCGMWFLQRGGVSLASSAIIYNIVKVKVTRWPADLFDPLTRRPVWPVDPSTCWPFRKRSPQGQLRGPLTYTIEMQCSKRRRIRLCCSSSKAKGAFCSCVAWGWRIYNIVESESDPLTRRPVDLFKKEPLKGKWEVHLHTATKFGEDPSKDLGGYREHTNKQTNAARIIVWFSNNVHFYDCPWRVAPNVSRRNLGQHILPYVSELRRYQRDNEFVIDKKKSRKHFDKTSSWNNVDFRAINTIAVRRWQW